MHWSVLFYVIYLGIPLAILLLFGLYRPKLAPLTILICPLVMFLIFHREFLYDTSQRGALLLILAAHTALVAIPALLIRRKAGKAEGTKGKE